MKLSLFVTCLGDVLRPEVGTRHRAAVAAAGARNRFSRSPDLLRPTVLQFRLCRPGREQAKRLIDVFDNDRSVVVPSGSCAAMVKLEFPAPVRGRRCLARPRRESGRSHASSWPISSSTGWGSRTSAPASTVWSPTTTPATCAGWGWWASRAAARPCRGPDLHADRSPGPVLRLRRLVRGPLPGNLDRYGHRQGELHHDHRRGRRGRDRRRLPDEHRRPARRPGPQIEVLHLAELLERR